MEQFLLSPHARVVLHNYDKVSRANLEKVNTPIFLNVRLLKKFTRADLKIMRLPILMKLFITKQEARVREQCLYKNFDVKKTCNVCYLNKL